MYHQLCAKKGTETKQNFKEEKSKNTYCCDVCGNRSHQDYIHWFSGGELGLCEKCYAKVSKFVNNSRNQTSDLYEPIQDFLNEEYCIVPDEVSYEDVFEYIRNLK